MTRVLITAFEPYDQWTANASWLALVALTRELPAEPQVTTRLYPVDLSTLRQRLRQDLSSGGYDVVLLTGQAPGSSAIRLESIGLNVHPDACRSGQIQELEPEGPLAYQSGLPLSRYVERLRAAHIPAAISLHAGTYLCNAALYLAHHFCHQLELTTKIAFIHLPLDVSQVARDPATLASLPAAISANALQLILAEIAEV